PKKAILAPRQQQPISIGCSCMRTTMLFPLMTRMRRGLTAALLAILLPWPTPARPAEDKPLDRLIAQAQAGSLAQAPAWLRLLHYQPAAGGWRSLVVTDHFFVSTDGRTQPQRELEASLRAFFEPVDEAKPDFHAQCRFPARLLWLQRQLPLEQAALPRVDCQKFRAWS